MAPVFILEAFCCEVWWISLSPVCFWVACTQQVADGFNALGWHLHSGLITTVAHRALCPLLLGFMAVMKKDSLNQVSMATVDV